MLTLPILVWPVLALCVAAANPGPHFYSLNGDKYEGDDLSVKTSGGDFLVLFHGCRNSGKSTLIHGLAGRSGDPPPSEPTRQPTVLPLSSANHVHSEVNEQLARMQRFNSLSRQGQVYALDTPGFGGSDMVGAFDNVLEAIKGMDVAGVSLKRIYFVLDPTIPDSFGALKQDLDLLQIAYGTQDVVLVVNKCDQLGDLPEFEATVHQAIGLGNRILFVSATTCWIQLVEDLEQAANQPKVEIAFELPDRFCLRKYYDKLTGPKDPFPSPFVSLGQYHRWLTWLAAQYRYLGDKLVEDAAFLRQSSRVATGLSWVAGGASFVFLPLLAVAVPAGVVSEFQRKQLVDVMHQGVEMHIFADELDDLLREVKLLAH